MHGIITVEDMISYINPGKIEVVATFVALNNFSLKDVDEIVDNFMFGRVLNNKVIDDREVEGKDISTLENNSLDEYTDPSRTQEINENRGILERKAIIDNFKSINEVNGKEIEKEITEAEARLKIEKQLKEKEELENADNKTLEQQEQEKEAFSRAGITRTALNKVSEDNRCKIDQINVRVLGTREALRYAEELTGANLRSFRRWRYNDG